MCALAALDPFTIQALLPLRFAFLRFTRLVMLEIDPFFNKFVKVDRADFFKCRLIQAIEAGHKHIL